ncbi:unnamed protein product [Lepeophtheirus salmonis]|uniref:(salmon louse) hypothetical protein n=1 Tax=Lepeophtheirus salmonis TaxID=72036 RepID=A0A7R8H928_LEPSM|nr:unnamed protein product [Lepeophtheirus salmonis]CAF2949922.1 unnamed protein product [Lepeophtheirus salmonis]
MTRTCIRCQISKVTRHTVSTTQPFKPTQCYFEHVHIHLVGLLPHSKSFKYLVSFVNRFTRWSEAITALTVTQKFIDGWILRFRIPLTITSDRGGQFKSLRWSCIMKSLGVSYLHTASYHPVTKSRFERIHRKLKHALYVHSTSHPSWTFLSSTHPLNSLIITEGRYWSLLLTIGIWFSTQSSWIIP